MSAREAADKWGVTRTTTAKWCRLGYVPGAIRVSSQWLIPSNLTVDDVKRRPTGRPPKNKEKTR